MPGGQEPRHDDSEESQSARDDRQHVKGAVVGERDVEEDAGDHVADGPPDPHPVIAHIGECGNPALRSEEDAVQEWPRGLTGEAESGVDDEQPPVALDHGEDEQARRRGDEDPDEQQLGSSVAVGEHGENRRRHETSDAGRGQHHADLAGAETVLVRQEHTQERKERTVDGVQQRVGGVGDREGPRAEPREQRG